MDQETQPAVVVQMDDHTLIQAMHWRATASGIELSVGPTRVTVDPLRIKRLFKSMPHEGLPLSPLARERNQIALGLLRAEALLAQYLQQQGKHDGLMARQEFALFGSTSLALTIIPERVSHDIDLIGSDDFADFVNHAQAALPATELRLEICHPEELRYCGQWRQRAALLTGTSQTRFLVMHPADTLCQKLLRLPSADNPKDRPDILAVLNVCQCERGTLLALLRESYLRFLDPLHGPAYRQNVEWFFAEFSRPVNLDQEIIQAALDLERRRRHTHVKLPAYPDAPLSGLLTD